MLLGNSLRILTITITAGGMALAAAIILAAPPASAEPECIDNLWYSMCHDRANDKWSMTVLRPARRAPVTAPNSTPSAPSEPRHRFPTGANITGSLPLAASNRATGDEVSAR